MTQLIGKWQVPVPSMTDNADGDDQLVPFATALDVHAKDITQGTLAARPAAGTYGRFYFATDVGVIFRDEGAFWKLVSAPQAQVGGSSLGTPKDGTIIDYLVQSGGLFEGLVWRFRYRSASLSSYKWEYVGTEQSLYAEQIGSVQVWPEVYNQLSGGPNLIVPLAGEYDIEFGARMWITDNGGGGGTAVFMAPSNQFGSAEDIDAIYHSAWEPSGFDLVTDMIASGSRKIRAVYFNPGTSVNAMYRVLVGGSVGWADRRWLRITPVRVA